MLLCGALAAWAKDIKNVEGKATFYIPTTMSYDRAREEVIRMAKIDALNNAFGNTIGVSNTLVQTEQSEYFYSNGFDFVRGEWIETIGTPVVTKLVDNDMFCLTCSIRGKAREKKTASTNIYVATLRNGTTAEYETADFKDGSNLYMLFKAPVDGYVTVYLHDPKAETVYCLLPYARQGAGSIFVEHDKEYVFFSKAHSGQPHMVDEYTLECSDDTEMNTLYVLFSPNQFNKTLTEDTGVLTPRNLSFADFTSWQARCQGHDPMFQVVTRTLVIRK